MAIVVTTLIGSFVVGILGGLFGVGGGVFLVPFLVVAAGLRPIAAVGVSILCVLGSSIGATGRALETGRVNIALALLLEPLLVVGALSASFLAQRVTDQTLILMFAAMMLGLAALFVVTGRARSAHAAVPLDGARAFDGVFLDRSSDEVVRYRPQRLAVVVPLAAVAGASSGLFGIGGGALIVPLLTFVGGVPLRAAAATSAFTMAVTGAAAGVVHIVHGTVPPVLAAASLVGVLPGGRLGARLQSRLSEERLRAGFALFALVVAVASLVRALGARP